MEAVLEAVIAAAKACGERMLQAKKIESSVSEKEGSGNFVTKYDEENQAYLRKELLRICPGARFIGEEDAKREDPGVGEAFVVDPIDGTLNFIRHYGRSAVSIALLQNGEPVLGVVHDPYLAETFSAILGKGATCNGNPIRVSSRPLCKGIAGVGTAPYYPELSAVTVQMVGTLFQNALDIRRSGSAALDLCDAACGRYDLFVETRLSPWDHAAGALIVREAGGKTSTMEGGPLPFDRPCSIVAGNPAAYADYWKLSIPAPDAD